MTVFIALGLLHASLSSLTLPGGTPLQSNPSSHCGAAHLAVLCADVLVPYSPGTCYIYMYMW